MRKRLQSSCEKPDSTANNGETPKDPGVCSVPIKFGKTTVLVRPGADMEAKRKLWQERIKNAGHVLRF